MDKKNNSNTPKRPDIFKAISEIRETDKETKNIPLDEVQKKWHMNDKIIDLFANNMEKDQQLREKYAVVLIRILACMLTALITIFVLVGCGKLQYSEVALNIFITGGIAEVFVLVRVIVKYLFKDNLTKALTIILENNNQLKYNRKTQQKYIKNSNKESDKPREI